MFRLGSKRGDIAMLQRRSSANWRADCFQSLHMFVQLGQRSSEGDVVDLLCECHTRIRNFLAIARRLALSPDVEPDRRRETATQVHRYFTQAFPLHIADEDELVALSLAQQSPGLDAALATMKSDHVDHAPVISSMLDATTMLLQHPHHRANGPALLAAVESAARVLEPHLQLEEREIFPALRNLPAVTTEEIRARMRERRLG